MKADKKKEKQTTNSPENPWTSGKGTKTAPEFALETGNPIESITRMIGKIGSGFLDQMGRVFGEKEAPLPAPKPFSNEGAGDFSISPVINDETLNRVPALECLPGHPVEHMREYEKALGLANLPIIDEKDLLTYSSGINRRTQTDQFLQQGRPVFCKSEGHRWSLIIGKVKKGQQEGYKCFTASSTGKGGKKSTLWLD